MPSCNLLNLMKSVCAKLVVERPLVHNITNFVVMNFTANVLISVGASPAMVHAVEEVEEFVAVSRALVVNIGTLDAGFVRGMERAAAKARAAGIPWVLDPVGVGATTYRNTVAASLLVHRPAIIRGNASEIIALAGLTGVKPKGVDSLAGSEEAIEAAKTLVARSGAVIAVTGATDYVVTTDKVVAVAGGHPMSQNVTGTGCATTALAGACLAVADPHDAAVAGLALMKRAAERAALSASGPGGFATELIDALHVLAREA